MRSPSKNRQELPAIRQFLKYCRVRNVPKGTMIVKAVDSPDALFYLLKGSVEVIIEDDSGHELVLAFLNRGHFFGEIGFFHELKTRSAWVRARGECDIAEMNYPRFREMIADKPDLVFEMATQLATRLARTNLKISDLAFMDVTGRVAHALIDLAGEPDAQIVAGGTQVEITRPALARIVGCSREMVSKVLKVLVAQGLIADAPGGILVKSEGLEQGQHA